MSNKQYKQTAGTIFLTVAIFHLIRAVLGWDLVVNGSFPIPLWISWAAVILLSWMVYQAFGKKD